MLIKSHIAFIIGSLALIHGIILPSSVPRNILCNYGASKRQSSIIAVENSLSIYDVNNQNKNFFKGVIEILTNTMNRFITGTKDFIQQATEVEKIKKFKAKYGEDSLTYTQFKLLGMLKYI